MSSRFYHAEVYIFMPQKKTITRWAIHKVGTEQLGYLCSFKDEAEHMLEDLKKDIYQVPSLEIEKYKVVEVQVSWIEKN